MPKRTNSFQKIVTLIQKALYPDGATVLASHMVPGLTPGKFREIDVYVETKLGPCKIKLAVEAKDESRRFDVTAMEEIVGKYRGRNNISVDKVIVITHRGFTTEAEALAKAENIETMTLEEAEAADWKQRFTCPIHGATPWTADLPQTFSYQTDPMVELVTVVPLLGNPEDDRAVGVEGRLVCKCHGHIKADLIGLARSIVATWLIPDTLVMAKLREIATQNKGTAAAHFVVPITELDLRFRDRIYPIEAITIRARLIDACASLEIKRMVMKDESGKESFVQYGEATLAGKKIQMLMPVGAGFERGVLKILDEDEIPEHDYQEVIWRLESGKWTQIK